MLLSVGPQKLMNAFLYEGFEAPEVKRRHELLTEFFVNLE